MPLQWKRFGRLVLWCPVLVVSLAALVACGGGGGGDTGDTGDTGDPTDAFVTIVPVAYPGLDQHVETGDTVQLDGSGSTNPGGGLLNYSWDMSLRPANSSAQLLTPDEVTSSFTADADGVYEVYLTVFDANSGIASDPVKTIIISVKNSYVQLFSIEDDSFLYKSADGGYYLSFSRFYSTITNNSQLTFRILKVELFSGTTEVISVDDSEYLGGDSFLPGETVAPGEFVLNSNIKDDNFEFRYYLIRPDTSEEFVVRYIYSN